MAEGVWFEKLIQGIEKLDARRDTPPPPPSPRRPHALMGQVLDEEDPDGWVKVPKSHLVEVPDQDGEPAMFAMELGDDFK